MQEWGRAGDKGEEERGWVGESFIFFGVGGGEGGVWRGRFGEEEERSAFCWAMFAFGFSGLSVLRVDRPMGYVGSCGALAPGFPVNSVSVDVTGEECGVRTRFGRCRVEMITRKQRRLRKEAKRKRQEAKDELVFLQIDAIVDDLKEGVSTSVVGLLEELSRSENELNEAMCNYLSNSLARLVPAPHGMKLIQMLLNEQAAREIPYRTATFNTMIKCCSMQNDYEGSKWWYNRMEEVGVRRDISSYNNLLLAASSRADIDVVESTWNDMKLADKRGTVATFNSMIKAYENRGDLRGVRGAYRRMKENGVVPTWYTYDSLIRVYGSRGEFDLVESVLKDMERNDSPPDARVFSRIIRLCAANGDKKAVQWWLKRMMEQRLHPNDQILSMMVEAYVLASDVQGAEEIIVKMKTIGVEPDLRALNFLMLGYAAVGDVSGAKSVLVRMHKYRIVPDVWTYNVLLDVLASAGDVTGAEMVFYGMSKKGVVPQPTTFGRISRMFHQHALHRKLIKLIDELERYQSPPTEKFFSMVVNAMVFTAEVSKAPTLLLSMKRREEEFLHRKKPLELLNAAVDSDTNPIDILRSLRSLRMPVSQRVFAAVIRYLKNQGDEEGLRRLVALASGNGFVFEESTLAAAGEMGKDLKRVSENKLKDIDEENRTNLEVTAQEEDEDVEDEDLDGEDNGGTTSKILEKMRQPERIDVGLASQEENSKIYESLERPEQIVDDGTASEDKALQEMELHFRLYWCLLSVLDERSEESSPFTNLIPVVDRGTSFAQPVRRTQKKIEPLSPPKDFRILPRKSEIFEDAGK